MERNLLANESPALDRRLIWLMAVTCGLSEANLIYMQPLLAAMGQSFATSINLMGIAATLSPLGYALGLLLIVPLGEMYNQRKLIMLLLAATVLSLLAMAIAPTILWLILASFLIGLTAVTPELIIPFAARLAPTEKRGQVVGTVLCGLLISTPLANILSGFVGAHLGWRAMYWIAVAIIITLAAILYLQLPDDDSTKGEMRYLQLLGSLWDLLRSEPVLQEISILGAIVYGALSLFWVTLPFILETPPFHYGSDVVGLFGLVGIVGAFAALFVGKWTDRRDARYANAAALVVTLFSFVVMWLYSHWLIGLILGALLLALGAQSNQVANETRLYLLPESAWNRLNTIYIFLFCIGGSLGSLSGAFSWSLARWNGAYSIACFILVAALGFFALYQRGAIVRFCMRIYTHMNKIRNSKRSVSQEDTPDYSKSL
jgi:predicted MFS family arabinose efflux permease